MKKKNRPAEIMDYDKSDTSQVIDRSSPIKFQDLGFKLPDIPPTQVVSIRLPTRLLNEIKAMGSQKDIPYQALIKIFLTDSISRAKKKTG